MTEWESDEQRLISERAAAVVQRIIAEQQNRTEDAVLWAAEAFKLDDEVVAAGGVSMLTAFAEKAQDVDDAIASLDELPFDETVKAAERAKLEVRRDLLTQAGA